MSSKISTLVATFILTLSLVMPSLSMAQTIQEKPSALAMTGDAIFVRPAMLAITLVGTAVFIISSPFSALGGNLGEAANVLIVDPAKTTFVRCLGCTINGRAVSEVVKQKEEK
jgi:hypothetical protein